MGTKTRAPVSIPIPAGGRLGALLRVPVDYILEVYLSGSITTMIALPHSPSTYSQERPSATALTHTLGDVVRELTPNHLTEISLGGVSGYAPRMGNTRDGGVSVLSGRRILEEFDRFLDEYQTLASQHVDDVFMVFRALNENQAYRVEPMSWRWSEDASSDRFSYKWELHLEAYAGAPASPRGSVFSPLTEVIKTTQEYISAGAGAIGLANNALENVRSELEVARDALRSLSRISNEITRISTNVDGITRFFTHDIVATYSALADSYRRAWDDARELVGVDDQATNYASEILNYNARVIAGLTGADVDDLNSARDSAPLTERDERRLGVSDEAQKLTRIVTFRAGDTLQRIASRAYGDASRWAEIAEHNGLRNASQWGDGRPLRVGDELAVPLDSSVANDLGLARRGDVFGRDLKIDSTGDLMIDDDLVVVQGAPNLEQALRLRLLSEQGSALYAPEYGLPVAIGSGGSARVVAFVASHIDQQLRADPRIEDVRELEITDEGDALVARASVQPIRGGATQFVIPMRRE